LGPAARPPDFFAPRAMSGRSGYASSAALRPAFACDRAGASRGGAPRCSPETAPATPPRGTSARDPHAPASWLLSPAGRISPPPSRLPRTCLSGFAKPRKWRCGFVRPDSGRGVFNPPLGCGSDGSGDRGADLTTTLPCAADLLERSRQTKKVAVRVRPAGVLGRSERGRARPELCRTPGARENRPEGQGRFHEQAAFGDRSTGKKRKPPRSGRQERGCGPGGRVESAFACGTVRRVL
jgi:hypothetical protein